MQMIKSYFIMLSLLLFAAYAGAAETVVWQGTKTFASWSDVLNIDGSKLSKAKADDVLHFTIAASKGAQLQISWGSSWTNFDGLSALGISGDYDMVVSTADLSRLRQGIHIKGVKYTLKAVTLRSNDGKYATLSDELFSWQDMLLSGAVQGQSCVVNLKAYGGAGWYWTEPVDMSGYGSLLVHLLQPAAENMTLQVIYNENSVKSQTIVQGATEAQLMLTAAHQSVSSVNIISEKAQMVAIGSVNLTDKQGNAVSASIDGPTANGSSEVVAEEYFTTAGVKLSSRAAGVNIVRRTYGDGRRVVSKRIVNHR